MKKPILISLFALISLQVFNQSKYDFDSTKYGYETIDALVTGVVENLKANKNSDEFLKFCVTQDAVLYFIEQGSIIRNDTRNTDEVIASIKNDWDKAVTDFKMVFDKLKWIIEYDTVDASKLSISNIDTVTHDRFGLAPKIIHGAATLELKIKKESYSLYMEGLIRLKDKWFVFDPFIKWQGVLLKRNLTKEEVDKKRKEKAEMEAFEKELRKAMEEAEEEQ